MDWKKDACFDRAKVFGGLSHVHTLFTSIFMLHDFTSEGVVSPA